MDDQLNENFSDTTKRVQQLFLTGDQIYADDVGSCLLPQLNQIGIELIGDNRAEELEFEGTE